MTLTEAWRSQELTQRGACCLVATVVTQLCLVRSSLVGGKVEKDIVATLLVSVLCEMEE